MNRVLHLGKYFPPFLGGIEKVAVDLVDGINDDNFSSDILCCDHCLNRNTDHVVEHKKYRLFRAKTYCVVASTPISLDYIILLKKIHSNYDIIHVHLPNPLANLALFLVRPKAKIILHWHSDIVKQQILLKFYSPLLKWLLNRSDKIIATSPKYIDESSFLPFYRNKTLSIPIGIDIGDIPCDHMLVQAIKNKYPDNIIVFSLGRLVYYKGFEVLIEAIASIRQKVIVLIGGTGAEFEALKAKINNLQLENKVMLLGNIPFKELGAYYAACDIFCLPSIAPSEAFGVVQIEAMGFGKPVISCNIYGSGVSWVNRNMISGVTVTPSDSKELSDAIVRLSTDKELHAKLSDGALKRYKDKFQKIQMISNTRQLYCSTLIGH